MHSEMARMVSQKDPLQMGPWPGPMGDPGDPGEAALLRRVEPSQPSQAEPTTAPPALYKDPETKLTVL